MPTVAVLTGLDEAGVVKRLAKALGLKVLSGADEHDLREAVRIMRGWLERPASCTLHRRPRIERPAGMGRLPRPRIDRHALAAMDCALCANEIKAGALTGRARPHIEAFPYPEMGWLCQHCLYERRSAPRRRDVVLLLWHQLFAGLGTDLNSRECEVLLAWITSIPAYTETPVWRRDPLDGVLVRLATSVHEDKPSTALDIPSVHTIIDLLVHADPSPEEAELLSAVSQHRREWETNPAGLKARKFGTGVRYRAQILATTTAPTVLSVRGGPFFLHAKTTVKSEMRDASEDGAVAEEE